MLCFSILSVGYPSRDWRTTQRTFQIAMFQCCTRLFCFVGSDDLPTCYSTNVSQQWNFFFFFFFAMVNQESFFFFQVGKVKNILMFYFISSKVIWQMFLCEFSCHLGLFCFYSYRGNSEVRGKSILSKV